MSASPSNSGIRSDAGQATAEEGLVMLDGPDGVAVTMTAGAARRTGEALIAAAGVAEEQNRRQG